MVALDSGGLGRIEGKRKEMGKGIVGWKQICHWGVSDVDCGQVGLGLPEWNFCDIFANDSIELLKQCGIDFTKNNQMAIDSNQFLEILMSFGVVLNDCVQWVWVGDIS
ncbi:hypothetical protein RJ640_008941 [Escallonia rubra]|uniref:Uncharacterized protein n=1 Tax=Escallonia rubra TaxID=112253 RepID=A0AA88RW78_9ASTE|nr:hypothetical protein RJ640_008941 [Escallonia rubra]